MAFSSLLNTHTSKKNKQLEKIICVIQNCYIDLHTLSTINLMNQTIYVVQQRNSDGQEYAQTFMMFSEALTYFHNLCERNNIKSNVWVQTPSELSAKGNNTIIQLQINII